MERKGQKRRELRARMTHVSSRGLRMPLLLPLVLEPRTVVETPAAPLPLMLTMAPNLPPASQDGPRREAIAGGYREHRQTTRTGPTTRVPLQALGSLAPPSLSLQQEALPLLPSRACWCMGPRGKMRTRLGVSAGSSPPVRSLPRWNEHVAAARRKSGGWRRKDVQPALRS